MKIPTSHPRYTSLLTRGLIEEGVKDGITSLNGLIAHGRGEAFDYLLAETTHDFAKEAVDASCAMLLLARHPVISVNGNTAALVPKELIHLAELLNAPLEVNLFHPTKQRLLKIEKHLKKFGAENVLLPNKNYVIKHLDSPRKYVNPGGVYRADVVFGPLEDGDRTEALIKNEKKIITVDLNPLSQTAQKATITIVDNIVRTMPILIKEIKKMRNKSTMKLLSLVEKYDNEQCLEHALHRIQFNRKQM